MPLFPGQGPVGATGPAGSTGPAGPTGATGANGTTMYDGYAIINFGNTPGTNIVYTVVTGQTNILSTSAINVFMMADSTVSGSTGHNSEEHKIVPIKLTAANIVPGVGFTIYAESIWRLTSTFNVRFMWIQ